MRNKAESKSKIKETTPLPKIETDEIELFMEKGVNVKIAVKSFQESVRPYFSSPCLLSEMEDTDDTFNF